MAMGSVWEAQCPGTVGTLLGTSSNVMARKRGRSYAELAGTGPEVCSYRENR